MPSLAISGDLSDFEEEQLELEQQQTLAELSKSSSSSASSIYSTKAASLASNKELLVERLSWPRRFFQVPVLAVITLGVLPFIQGCLYTIGYRYGRRLIQQYIKVK